MKNRPLLNTIPIGLLELDASGTVLYFKPDREGPSNWSASEVVGRNLFRDIAPIAEDSDFQERIKAFRRKGTPADSFHFTFGVNQNYLSVKVLLARIHEQSELGSMESMLVHIRPQAGRMAA